MKKYLSLFAVLGLLVACQGKENPSGGDDNGGGNKEVLATAVDLGLSVKWANANLGASAPEEYGDYYAWGETKIIDNSWVAYKWCNGDAYLLTKYNDKSDCGVVDNKTVLDAADDVAHVKLGGKWRMPTSQEVDELVSTIGNNSYKWEWKTLNGHNGWSVTYLTNNQSIFLPAAGFRVGSVLSNVGELCFYWSSSLYTDYPCYAWGLYFDDGDIHRDSSSRYYGEVVRPVTE